jgi:hypothetical protein
MGGGMQSATFYTFKRRGGPPPPRRAPQKEPPRSPGTAQLTGCPPDPWAGVKVAPGRPTRRVRGYVAFSN